MINDLEKKELTKVKYKNEIDELNIASMTSSELNAFCALLSSFKNVDPKDPIRTFSFKQFRELANLPTNFIRNEKMESFLEQMIKKITAGTININTYEYFSTFVLFERITVSREKKTISAVMSQSCIQYFCNYLKGYYTTFPLIDFVKLKSKYAKLLYRALSRYKSSGEYICEYDYFINNVLCAPKSFERYRILSTIVNPAVKELKKSNYFKDLVVLFSKDPNNSRRYQNIYFKFSPSPTVESLDESFNKTQSGRDLNEVFKSKNNQKNEEDKRLFSVYQYIKDLDIWDFYFSYPTLKEAKESFILIQLGDGEKYKITKKQENGEEIIIDTNVSAEELGKIGKGVAEETDELPF